MYLQNNNISYKHSYRSDKAGIIRAFTQHSHIREWRYKILIKVGKLSK